MIQVGRGFRLQGAGLVLGCWLLAACGDDRVEPGSSADPNAGGRGNASSGGSKGSQGGSNGSGASDGSGGTKNDGGGTDEPMEPTECNDGIDNDGDGYVDWQSDLGCWGPGDNSETARPRDEENGFTTWEIGEDSKVVYVSAEGDDSADGATPETAVKTLTKAASLVRDGQHDFILLRRGDTWRGQTLGRFKSGKDADHPLVIGSYGDSTKLPRIEVSTYFINHDGQARNYLALVDLNLVIYPRNPDDPEYTGRGDELLRFVGGGKNLLVEGCHFEYGGIIVQSYQSNVYEDVEFRRNVVEKVFISGNCEKVGPSGLYSHHVERLTLEGNLFDHNGWNEDVEDACATMYNHNLYLNGNDITLRDNILVRASSMAVKLRSDATGDMSGTLIENNYIAEGEIGISIGGNNEQTARFVDSIIRNNVLSDIGRTQPTKRTLAWGIEVLDNDGLEISGNYFLNQRQPGVSNSYAINISNTEKDISVTGNLFYRIQGRSLSLNKTAGHSNVEVTDNTFFDPDQKACLIGHSGSFSGYTYSGNEYFSSASANSWFCADGGGSMSSWKTKSGESNAKTLTADVGFADPDRSVETYAESLGLEPTLESFVEAARLQSRLNYAPRLTANALNDYIREGFER
jgi:hypothetical protein